MKTVIIYYTFGGSTMKEAKRLGEELNAPLIQVKEVSDRSLIASFIPGGMLARSRKSVPIYPSNMDLNDYDRIIIGCPVWAGYPAPAFNAIVEQLPSEKEVELFLCSGGGDTSVSEQETKELLEKKGLKVISYRNVRTGVPPRKMKETDK
jgi:flavodoxin